MQLSRDLDVQHKTAFVLAHKIREALSAESKSMKLAGDIEIDGAYFGGHVRPANHEADRVDRRLSEHQTGKRRVVIAARARKGRTRTFVAMHEAEGVRFLNSIADPWARIHADEASHWDMLHAHYPVKRINHSLAYSDETCTNQAESYFSRLRRMVQGQHHFVSPQHLHQYAAHAAWNEDHRRVDNGGLAYRTIGLALHHLVSRDWKGYWQK